MKAAEHTAGPWHVNDTDPSCPQVVGTDDSLVTELPTNGDKNFSEALCLADARLIAAAPELLAACEAAKKHLEPDLVEPGRTVFWKLVDAIAKAKGGAQ